MDFASRGKKYKIIWQGAWILGGVALWAITYGELLVNSEALVYEALIFSVCLEFFMNPNPSLSEKEKLF